MSCDGAGDDDNNNNNSVRHLQLQNEINGISPIQMMMTVWFVRVQVPRLTQLSLSFLMLNFVNKLDGDVDARDGASKYLVCGSQGMLM